MACWSRRLSLDDAQQKKSERWRAATLVGDKSGNRFACTLDQHVAGLYELGLGLKDRASSSWQVASSLVRVVVEEFQVYSLVPSKAPINTESIIRINGTGLLAMSPPFAQGLACRFGASGPQNAAKVVGDELIECVSPKMPRPVGVSLLFQPVDGTYHRIVLNPAAQVRAVLFY